MKNFFRFALLIVFIWFFYERPFVAADHLVPKHITKTAPTHLIESFNLDASNLKHGVDISHFQGKVDFQKLQRSGIDFVYFKATEGESYVDPTYVNHKNSIHQTDLLHGAYHFFDPRKDPIKQAEHFLIQINGAGHVLPPALDIEVSHDIKADEIKKGVKTWLKKVHLVTGCKPILYSNSYFWRNYLGTEFNDYIFWLADYSEKIDIPKNMQGVQFWQYSQKGRTAGVQAAVDLNVGLPTDVLCND